MSQAELATGVAELILGAARWLTALIRNRWRIVMTGAVLFGVIFLLGSAVTTWYGSFFAKEIVLLVGPPGSTSWRQGDDFANAIVKASPAFGLKYRVRQQLTDGYDEIQHLVANDTSGTFVGFGFEAINPSLNTPQVLVPLNWEYVHVLCSRKFIVENYYSRPTRLTDVLPEIASGRVYLGPRESGTRRIAERILSRCGIEPDDYYATGIDDWTDAEAAMGANKIDLVFYSGPLGSKTVEKFAKTSVLLDLDDMSEAVANEASYSIWEAELAQNSSYVNVYRSDADAIKSLKNPDAHTRKHLEREEAMQFCPDAVKTVATRGLLICSPAMSPYDAFQIAESVQKNCRGIQSDVWTSQPLQKKADSQTVTEISLPIHPGAQRLKNNQPYYEPIDPRGWPQWLQAALLTLFTALFGLLVGHINEIKDSSSTPVDVPTIHAKVEALHHQISSLPKPGKQEDVEPLEEEVARLRKEIRSMKSKSAISENEFNDLRGQLHELSAMIFANQSDPPATMNSSASPQEKSIPAVVTGGPVQPGKQKKSQTT